MTGCTASDASPVCAEGSNCGMGLRDVVALHERRRRQLPVHRQQAGFPPLDAQRLHLPCVVGRGERLDTVAQRGRIVVEVDPGAATPQFASDGDQGRDRLRHMLSSSKASGRSTKVLRPSMPQHQPWNGQTKVRRDPLPSTSFTPRWRQALW